MVLKFDFFLFNNFIATPTAYNTSVGQIFFFLAIILSCFCFYFSFFVKVCFIAHSLMLAFLFLQPLALLSLPQNNLIGSRPFFPSPPDFLYKTFQQKSSSLLNPHLLLTNNPKSISDKLAIPASRSSFIIIIILHLILALWRVVFLHCHVK